MFKSTTYTGSGGGGSGTVTSVSVTSANGFAGTVANPSTSPAISLTTTATGVLAGSGGSITAAVSGTDIKTINGSSILGSGNLTIGGSGSPGGLDTQVQFNDAGAFAGSAGFTYNKTTSAVTIAGSTTFSGLGKRLIGDFTNATISNRLAFQTSTANSSTIVPIIANGTGGFSSIVAFAGSDADNASYISLHADNAGPHVGLNSAKSGTGTTRDLVFQIDGVTKASITTGGNFNIVGLTASQIIATDASKNLQTLSTATYPSLTELSYVKGVSSAIQTQLNTKITASSTDTLTNKTLTSSTNTLFTLTTTGTSGPASYSGNTLNIPQYSGGGGITALTGDVTASGTGSVAATLATVNSNVGSFGSASNIPTYTVNAKGLITAASNTAIQITESQVTNLTTDLAAKANLAGATYTGQYAAQEFDNGNVTGTDTIDWNNGNVQYVTMTGNTTFTFTNPIAGGRYLLHVAGAFTPTLPSTCRWSGGTVPTPTATSGKKDLYTFVYCGKESLYDGSALLNLSTT